MDNTPRFINPEYAKLFKPSPKAGLKMAQWLRRHMRQSSARSKIARSIILMPK